MRRRAQDDKVREIIRGQAIEVMEDQQCGVYVSFQVQLGATGGFEVVGEGHVMTYNLYFQKDTLAATIILGWQNWEQGDQRLL